MAKIATATKLPKSMKTKTQKPVTSSKLAKLGSIYEEMTFATFAGLNNKFANTEVADNEVVDVLDVDFDDVGAPTQRNGYVLQHNFGTSQINSIMPFFTTPGARRMIVAYGTNLIDYDPVANSASTITTTLHGSSLRFSSSMDDVHNKIYMMNGDTTDGLMSWDGTTFKTKVGTSANAWAVSTTYALGATVSNSGNVYVCIVAGTSASSGGPTGNGQATTDGTVTWSYVSTNGSSPNGKYVLWYKNRLYITGDSANPNRLYMSDQGDPTSWPDLNFIDFDQGSGGITGIRELGDGIVVHKETGLFYLTGADPSTYTVVDTFAGYRGAVSQWSIVNVPNGQIFLARDGVWLFTGKTMELLSYKIGGSFENWNQSQLANAVAFEYDYKYWLSVPENVTVGNATTIATTNNYTYAYNYQYNFWTRYSLKMQASNRIQGSDFYYWPYFSDTAGNVFKADTGITDNGNPISSYLLTKAYNFGTAAHIKTFKQIFMEALAEVDDYKLYFTFILDFGKSQQTLTLPLAYSSPTVWGAFAWGQSNWGNNAAVIHGSTGLPGQATYLQFKLQSSGPFTFNGWTVRYKIKQMMTR